MDFIGFGKGKIRKVIETRELFSAAPSDGEKSNLSANS